MKHSLRTTILALSVGLLGNLQAAPTPTQISSIRSTGRQTKSGQMSRAIKTRVMCIGDSNTHGVQGYTSYRYPLWFSLRRRGSLVSFVGTRFTVENENGTSIPDLNLFNRYYTYFDRDHQGYSGYRTDQVLPLLPPAIASETPDVCLILLGTNDIGQRGSNGINSAVGNLKATLEAVRSQGPATIFFIASIPPIGTGTWYFNNAGFVSSFNSLLETSIPSWSTPLSPVNFVDVHAALDVATDMLPDGIHPNQQGQRKIAQVFHNAILPVVSGGFRPAPLNTVTMQAQSFESLDLADGVSSVQPIPDWTYPNMPHVVASIMNPDSFTYSGAGGSAAPTGADGDEVLSLENSGGGPGLGWVYQIMPTTLESNQIYNLSIAVGHRSPTNTRGSTGFGGYEIQLLAGNTVVASSMNQVAPVPGSFAPAFLQYDSQGAQTSLIGAPLTVRMRLTWSAANTATDFDLVELSKL
ncbi:MAG: hypothetical protein GY930_16610 [bacterium]|nr:hypothetical protein [bacterium]